MFWADPSPLVLNLPPVSTAGLPIARCSTNYVLSTVVAGIGLAGLSGDGGLASAAALSFPSGLAFAAAGSSAGGPNGTLYIADTNNFAVRSVDGPSSPRALIQTTVMSFDSNSHLAGVTALEGHPSYMLIVVDPWQHGVYGLAVPHGSLVIIAGQPPLAGSADEGAIATRAPLDAPVAAVWAAGTSTYYIAEEHGRRVRTVSWDDGLNTWLMYTAVGFGNSSLLGVPSPGCGGTDPRSVDLIPRALLFVNTTARTWLLIADGLSNCVRALDLRAPFPVLVRVVGNGGAAPNTLLRPVGALDYSMISPTALAYDPTADALLVASPDGSNAVVAVPLTSSNSSVSAVVLQSTVNSCLSGLAYDDDSRTLFVSTSCAGAYVVKGMQCLLTAPSPSPSASPSASPTATATSSVSAASSLTASPSSVPPSYTRECVVLP